MQDKDVIYRALEAAELTPEFFRGFDRTQEVRRCWRKENGRWVLRHIAFTEHWGPAEFEKLAACLQNTLRTGGVVFGALCGGRVIGFASVENEPFGAHGEYRQLSSLHVSRESRGCGIGRILFYMACDAARRLGAEKLYISSHSCEETQAFYRAVGCVEAKEYNPRLVEAEPCDCQLERAL